MIPIDIDCVDGTGSDAAIRILLRQYPHALRVVSVGQMVPSILGRLGTGRIRRLRIFGHGAPGIQGLGGGSGEGPRKLTTDISLNSVRLYAGILGQLYGRFHRWTEGPGNRVRRGWVELHGCNVGRGVEGKHLLHILAMIWGVNVAAATNYQLTDPGFEGSYIVARPDGRVEIKVRRELYYLPSDLPEL